MSTELTNFWRGDFGSEYTDRKTLLFVRNEEMRKAPIVSVCFRRSETLEAPATALVGSNSKNLASSSFRKSERGGGLFIAIKHDQALAARSACVPKLREVSP